MVNKDFYIEFGKVVYAVAMADGKIQAEEEKVLRTMVKEELAKAETGTDSFGTDLAYYTLFSFEKENEVEDTVEDAFHSFFLFLDRRHPKPSKDVSEACIHLLKKVASSYGRVTVKEKGLIVEFEKRFRKYLN